MALEDEFHDDVVISGEGTPSVTGFLEVQIVGGKLLHSKQNGDGHVSKSSMLKIIAGIKEFLTQQ